MRGWSRAFTCGSPSHPTPHIVCVRLNIRQNRTSLLPWVFVDGGRWAFTLPKYPGTPTTRVSVWRLCLHAPRCASRWASFGFPPCCMPKVGKQNNDPVSWFMHRATGAMYALCKGLDGPSVHLRFSLLCIFFEFGAHPSFPTTLLQSFAPPHPTPWSPTGDSVPIGSLGSMASPLPASSPVPGTDKRTAWPGVLVVFFSYFFLCSCRAWGFSKRRPFPFAPFPRQGTHGLARACNRSSLDAPTRMAAAQCVHTQSRGCPHSFVSPAASNTNR